MEFAETHDRLTWGPWGTGRGVIKKKNKKKFFS